MNHKNFGRATELINEIEELKQIRKSMDEQGVYLQKFAARVPDDVLEAGAKALKDYVDAKINAHEIEFKAL